MSRNVLDLGDMTLVLRCTEAWDLQARAVLQMLAGLRGRDKGLADGVTVQLGWSMLTLQRLGRDLIVHEPDFARDPFHDLRDDVTVTLAVLARQAAVLNRVAVKGVPVRWDDKMVIARGCLGERRVYMQRADPRPGDSGWYVGPVDLPGPGKDPGGYEAVYVFEVLNLRDPLLQMIALPQRYLVVFDGDKVEAIVDGDDKNRWTSEP
jgi:hypothetical protein